VSVGVVKNPAILYIFYFLKPPHHISDGVDYCN